MSHRRRTNKLKNAGFLLKAKQNEITIKVENNFITSSLKTILNNFDIEDLYINEPPVDEIIGKILMKKDYGTKLIYQNINSIKSSIFKHVGI